MSQPQPIKILYVGGGAVGAFYASRMEQAGAHVQVSLVLRSNYKTVAEGGFQLQTRNFGDYHFRPHGVFPNVPAAAEKGERWDYVVVSTKALPDQVDDSELIAPLVTPPSSSEAEGGGFAGTAIVLIQNGVGVEAPHRARFPQNPIVSAVTVISAVQLSQGLIKQNRWTRISLGPYTDGIGGDERKEAPGRKAVEELVRIWSAGGIKDAEAYDEKGLQLVRWHKLTINASMNPSAVLSGGAGNAIMAKDPELRLHLQGVMDEIYKAAPAILGRPFPESLASPEKILKSTERNTGSKPSMLLDWEADRPLELEVILGNPVRIARERGVDMPRAQSLYALLRMAQARKIEEKQNKAPKSKL